MTDEPIDEAQQGHRWPALLPWQRDALRDSLAMRARWPHALLVSGPAGIGKRRLALEFARTLLCERPLPDGAACGECDACRYVAAGQHPDLRLVEPVELDDEGTATRTEWIGVDAIRAMIRWVQLTSHRRIAKVAVIAPAERMNAAATNALLKTLEEPPEQSYLVLVSHQPGRLAPTVRSRCAHMIAPVPDASAARAWLVDQGVQAPDALLAQSRGAPLGALALADASYQGERAAWLRALAAPGTLVPSDLAGRIDLAPREQRKQALGAAIDWLLGWCADLAAVRAGAEPRINRDHASELEPIASNVAPMALFRYHRSLLEQRALLSHPLTPRLVAEALLIEYRTLFR